MARRMRSISFDLMPLTLQEKGLVKAIQEFAGYVNTSLQIRFIKPTDPVELNDAQTIHIYRIVQEIIYNAIRHAGASELTMAITKDRNYLVLATNDNGAGFDYQEQLKNSKGLGLKSLMNRIYLLQAEFLIDSKPGKGTSITIRIPQQHD
jgi:signal transduction histidine kinase